MNLERLKVELERDEDRRLRAYRDNAVPPNWTIGIGHLLGESPRMSDITDFECDALYEADVREATHTAEKFAGGTLDPVRQRALVNMAFNLGSRIFEFKLFRAALNSGDWGKAAHEMLDSKWETDVGDRAHRLAQMIATGAEP